VQDAALLASLSPLQQIDRVRVPVLVVHGALDTNVPINEAHQVVDALKALGRDVDYLELPGEGHEYRRVASRRLLLETMARFLLRTLADDSEYPTAGQPVVQTSA
jgi:dipeptidyl aminopeptidase/acylaminoacyl peptidase